MAQCCFPWRMPVTNEPCFRWRIALPCANMCTARHTASHAPPAHPFSSLRYAAEVAHNVSSRKRKEIVERAEMLNIKVLNGAARLKTEENE